MYFSDIINKIKSFYPAKNVVITGATLFILFNLFNFIVSFF